LQAFATNGVAQRAADALEAGLDHVMRVLACDLHMNGGAEGLTERAEKMRHELGRESPHFVPTEGSGELRKRSPRQINRNLRFALIHRQEEPVSGDAELGAKRPAQCFA